MDGTKTIPELGVFHFLKTCRRGGMARYHLGRRKQQHFRAGQAGDKVVLHGKGITRLSRPYQP